MSRRFNAQSRYSGASPASNKPRDNDPDPDPEPPAAPPVIILSQSGKHRVAHGSQNQEPDPAVGAQPHTSSPPPNKSANSPPSTARYNLRNKAKDPDPDPDPDPAPEPDPAPPIIILGHKRAASTSPARSTTPTTPPTTNSPFASTTSTSPKAALQYAKAKMGSKASKLSEQAHAATGKLQPSQSKADKEEMKEPKNYYTHRSKSMRRKAGGGNEVSGQGSGGGLA